MAREREDTGGVLRPPSVFSRDGSLLPSSHADVRAPDDVITFEKARVVGIIAITRAGPRFNDPTCARMILIRVQHGGWLATLRGVSVQPQSP